MKKKIISTVVLSTVAAGMLVGVVGADFSKLSFDERTEIKTLIEKSNKGVSLNNDEQKKLDIIKANFEGNKLHRFHNNHFKKGRHGFMKGLSAEEKESIKNMSDSERKEFFKEKREFLKSEREDRRVIREGHELIIDKLINREELNDDEKEILEEIKIIRTERNSKRLGKS